MSTIDWPVGELRWSYHQAAALKDVHIVIPQGGAGDRTVHATIVTMDAFKVRQRPLLLVVPFGAGGWHVIDLSIEDTRLTATLGPPVDE